MIRAFKKTNINAVRQSFSLRVIVFITPLLAALAISLTPLEANAADNFCTQTANLVFQACGHSAEDDFLVASAKCLNISNQTERTSCNADAASSRTDAKQLCQDQLTTRLSACKKLGESRYDPAFEAKDFDTDFNNLPNPNQYFPIRPGDHWEFRSATEIDTVDILNATKLIDGVRCVVAHDAVKVGGFVTESTNDWYAQAKDGNVWYCGEETAEFETFKGDNPVVPELVDISGHFKAGVEGDKPGIIFLASPKAGDVYLEEFSLANAEDVSTILTTTYSFGKFPNLDHLVPRKLAELLCSNDCIVTKDQSLLEPGIFARKYYAPGIGVFLEVELDTGTVSQLVKCNVDSRCAMLPPR